MKSKITLIREYLGGIEDLPPLSMNIDPMMIVLDVPFSSGWSRKMYEGFPELADTSLDKNSTAR
jgi:hypothetical protein